MQNKKKISLAIGTITLLIITVISLLIFHFSDYNQQKRADIERLSSEEYNSLFCSMYSIENFAEEDFKTFRGIDTIKLENALRNTSDVRTYLDTAFHSGNSIEIVYLGLDPAQIWESSKKNAAKWTTAIGGDILSYVSAHPEVTFEVLLPAPSMEYWLDKSSEETEEILSRYHSLIGSLSAYSNVITYFMGNEHWLIANPANYSDVLTTNQLISQKLMLFTFCDHQYQINAANAVLYLDSLKTTIALERSAPTEYPDLSSWDVVFFGDSIIGNYTGSFSIPGVVTGLSHANTYNCAQGGIPASIDPNCPLSFPSSVDYFIGQDASALPVVDGPFPSSLEEYAQSDHTDRKLCFVLNFGLNDYFGGHPVANPEDAYDTATYAGALREGISKLQTAYPDATIILMVPTFTIHFSNGTETTSEKGGILTEYVNAALQVAEEMNITCMNNYNDLGINEDNVWSYLSDGCHPNETGRFLMAERIIEQISTP